MSPIGAVPTRIPPGSPAAQPLGESETLEHYARRLTRMTWRQPLAKPDPQRRHAIHIHHTEGGTGLAPHRWLTPAQLEPHRRGHYLRDAGCGESGPSHGPVQPAHCRIRPMAAATVPTATARTAEIARRSGPDSILETASPSPPTLATASTIRGAPEASPTASTTPARSVLGSPRRRGQPAAGSIRQRRDRAHRFGPQHGIAHAARADRS